MNVLIVGAGAVGQVYGRHLALGGAHVYYFVREKYAAEFAAGGLPLVIARPEFIYGPGDVHVLGLFRAVRRGLFFYIGDGGNTCHPTYVDDMVDGLLACLRRGAVGGRGVAGGAGSGKAGR